VQTETIINKVRDLLPAIRARRQEIEQSRRMPRDLVDALRDTRMFAMGAPRAIGGHEATPGELMRAIESVATADGSAGWCAMIATGNGVSAGYLSDKGAQEVFADPTAPTAGIAAPAGAATRVDGGVRITGRWPFASGITHCDWLWAGCLVMDNGRPRMTPFGPEMVHACIPVRDVEILDTWFVSGLSGSGSNDFRVDDVFVPEHRLFSLLDPTNHRPEPLFQMPPLGLFTYQVASVSLGIARSALDELTALAQTKVPSLYTTPLADRGAAHIAVARAEAELGAARAFLYDTVEEIWRTVSSGTPPTSRQNALGRVAAAHAAETAGAVTRTASQLAGGSAIYSSSSLQRHARDANAVCHHFTVSPHTWEEAGRVFLGRAPTVPAF
jgi:alkylation response protein AidB-like acyl-CoA dehydrogenase